ncbi:HelD family protein [Alkalihalobacillus pseudalcaliphilus]|uniref:HelD family protein n=1 Tax=Alkalihalobacillus pseudalcaliphilus TaxID=79884 RepID=UPI00064D932D|nr:ATP-binding domain-containing protein [Alkalihalobacillus pseudalcaliphilus]KMK74969.1 hypothetical protein AB990_15950 [Alkalihalobacillus pseudalcaliphilus]
MNHKIEEVHLESTLIQLKKAYLKLTSNIDEQDQNFKSLQKYMVDYKNELDKFEVYNYQQSLSMIDKRGFAEVIEREQVKKLIQSPYFGRFDFVYDGDDKSEAETFYIGRFGFSDEDGLPLIYDWRAPVCNMYYEFELGKAFYVTNERHFEGELTLKRQIKVENSELEYVLDSSLTIQDEILQQTLNHYASEKMKTIVTSIQREQNKIVRNESAYNVIIQGVAGSGKTAVALHRIAYYLYKFSDTLRAERIFILSPNQVFGDYISTVLPELGEEPVRSMTLDELTKSLLPSNFLFRSFEDETREILANPDSALVKRAKSKGDYSFVVQLQTFLEELDLTLLKKENIKIAGVELSYDYLQSRFLHYRKEPVFDRLKQMVEDIWQVLKSKSFLEGKIPSKNEMMKRLKKRLLYSSTLAIYQAFHASFQISLFQFEDKSFEFNDVYPYLYVKLYVEGMKQYEHVQHFVLDEMQDYTPIQYAVLSKVFTCKRTIIGDFGQALFPYVTISKEAFEALFKQTEYVELTTTYRSTFEIAEYANRFIRHGPMQPIARHGEKPKEIAYSDFGQMMALIHQSVTKRYQSTAIICKNESDLHAIQKHLHVPFSVLDGQTKKFQTGIILTTIQYAKGLEFDAVIVPFVSDENYHTAFDCGLLYIAVTRAMHDLTILKDATAPSSLL